MKCPVCKHEADNFSKDTHHTDMFIRIDGVLEKININGVFGEDITFQKENTNRSDWQPRTTRVSLYGCPKCNSIQFVE